MSQLLQHRPSNSRGGIAHAVALLCGCLAFLLGTGEAVAAEVPTKLWQVPEDGKSGAGSGRVANPESVAADPATGHLFVADLRNARVVELDAWGQFVKAWGWDVAPDGAPGDTASDELETCTTQCQKGSEGEGAGQFKTPRGGITVDAAGHVYVGDFEHHRVQKFDPSAGPGEEEAEFLVSFGDKGSNDGQFETQEFGSYVAVGGPAEHVYVGDKGRIQEFGLDGSFTTSVILTGELAGKTVRSLDVDAVGNLYVTSGKVADVRKLDSAGTELATEFPVANPTDVALDADGNLYVASDFKEVIEFGPSGEKLIPAGSGFALVAANAALQGLATNTVTAAGGTDVYVTTGSADDVSNVAAYGPPPGLWPPPVVPPEITSQYAASVDTTGATLKAQINPKFWNDTAYYVQYGTAPCFEGGCQAQPAPPGSKLTSQIVDAPLTSAGVFLDGLEPDTAYHYRFVSESGGGGPVYGIDPDGDGPLEASPADGLEGVFTTFAKPIPQVGTDPCANAQFRIGASAPLPDCRAYELVSPLDKSGGDVMPLLQILGLPAALDQSATSGERLTYSAYRAFGEAESAPYTSQHLAIRDPGKGWQNESISPPRGINILSSEGTLEVQFRAFAPDLCDAWLMHDTDPPLDEDAPEGFASLYRTDLCTPAGYQALNTTKPSVKPGDFIPHLQGFSADGKHALFRARGKLAAGALPGEPQLYDSVAGKAQLVCILPNGTPSAGSCTAGTANEHPNRGIRTPSLDNSISADGSRVFWTDAEIGPGPIYVRVNGKSTVAIGNGRYWDASPDGTKVLFTSGGKLFLSDLTDLKTPKATLVAEGVKGLLGASEDLSHVYFLSEDATAAAIAEGASKGKPNLYLYETGTISYIATLSAVDAVPPTLFAASPASPEPYKHTSRVSVDGRHVAFMSTASLTGYDNTDVNSGEPDAEVFLYDADAEDLLCVSCNPSGVRPLGHEATLLTGKESGVWAAAEIPVWETVLYQPRFLVENGSRLFFESTDALVLRDTNGVQDVYQWEEPGTGDCAEQSHAFVEDAGGCVNLISSGQSPTDTEFVDADQDGENVFIKTGSSLLFHDPGLIDIYVARSGGGFPPPPANPPACDGEACQAPSAPPNDPTPASASFQGAGNLKAQQRRPRCAKRKARRKGRCVAKNSKRKQRSRHRATNDSRRIAR